MSHSQNQQNQGNDQNQNQNKPPQKEVSLEQTKSQPSAAANPQDKTPPAASRLPARADDQFTMGKRHR